MLVNRRRLHELGEPLGFAAGTRRAEQTGSRQTNSPHARLVVLNFRNDAGPARDSGCSHVGRVWLHARLSPDVPGAVAGDLRDPSNSHHSRPKTPSVCSGTSDRGSCSSGVATACRWCCFTPVDLHALPGQSASSVVSRSRNGFRPRVAASPMPWSASSPPKFRSCPLFWSADDGETGPSAFCRTTAGLRRYTSAHPVPDGRRR